ncbi:hypothetical protein [Streptomyces sp. TRM68367]|uniref:hypothetical protein n=1 Tax=Streptomyces sp. TRM68367 TaxID=2758415 RepID=UPI00165CAA08|nr:hypothetical protein [Streptomyces sp. TRM68367]MBC9723598.1 hypothetical protein [Streptomyces sp. TRM68367]
MLALRLTRGAQPAVHLRRLLVAAASAGTGFLLLCALGHAMSHPDSPGASALRLAWCAAPLAATVHFATAVARTDPGTRPVPGLSAIGLGPARLMAISATTTALSCTLGSMLALLFFLHLRGDLTGMPFDGAATDVLAADRPLPLPAALTLLSLVPAIASGVVAVLLRPREASPAPAHRAPRRYGPFGAYKRSGTRETFGSYGRFGAHLRIRTATGDVPAPLRPPTPGAQPHHHPTAGNDTQPHHYAAAGDGAQPDSPQPADNDGAQPHGHQPAGSRAAGAARVGADGTPPAPGCAPDPRPTPTPGTAQAPSPRTDLQPAGLPWGIATLTAGLAVQSYATGRATGSTLLGWALTALGLALAGPGLTHLCGRLLQTARPGALRLLAGRVLMAEATRIGRPLGVVCAVTSAAYATPALHDTDATSLDPLATLGALLVIGCTVATLLTSAVEAKHARADTTAALLRLGAPATMLRSAAALRAGALLALFGPLTVLVAELAALALAR